MLYSIIVPCYNCDDTIERLLDSIVIQNEPDLEVILVDDTEDHSFLTKSDLYKNKLNIKVVNTELKYHNPGNSRNYGLDVAQGEYILFIDCDDCLRPGALSILSLNIKSYPEDVCFFGLVKQFKPTGEEYSEDEEYQANHIVWLHGKCYKLEFLNKWNIRFKSDMLHCEDYYFNYQVLAFLLTENKLFVMIPKYLYNWMWNDNSISRKIDTTFNLLRDFEENLYATLIPWTKVPNSANIQAVYSWFKMFLVVNYFIYQFYLGLNYHLKKDTVIEALNKLRSLFGIDNYILIRDIESNPEAFFDYYKKAKDSYIHKDFVCPESFRTWILNMFM